MGLFDFIGNREKQPAWMSQLPKVATDMMISEIRDNHQACKLDEIPQGIGRFGLDPSNPIPIYGVPSNEIYLERLMLRDGGRIRWRREGSMENAIIYKPIDKYEIFDISGNTVCFLYLSPYHWKISNKAPEGFKFK